MARFLSDAWFDELSVGAERLAGQHDNAGHEHSSTAEPVAADSPAPELVVEVIASGAPEEMCIRDRP